MVIPVFALKSATTESGKYSPHIKTLTCPLEAAKAFLTYKGATLAKAVSAAPLLRSVLRLNVFTAFSVWCEEFLILLISSLHFLIYLSLNITV